MLIIRSEQMAAFANSLKREFEERLLAHLRARTGRAGGWLRRQIKRGVDDASAHNLSSELQVAAFIEITCSCLGGFPEGALPPPALAILGSYGIEPSLKLERYRAWAEAQRSRQEAG
jgi:hypothetical protein